MLSWVNGSSLADKNYSSALQTGSCYCVHKNPSPCNVRNIDLLIVALDKPECADEVSLAQLVNTGQSCFYKYLLFKVCAPQ